MKKLMAILLALAGLSLINISPSLAASQVGEVAPDFSLLTLDGNRFDLAEYRGKKPVHLIFWATWCSACKHEIPDIKKAFYKYEDKIAMVAINVSVRDSAEKVQRYVSKYKLPYPVAFDDGAKVTRLYGVMGTPTQIIIDKQGIIHYRGSTTPKDLSKYIEMPEKGL